MEGSYVSATPITYASGQSRRPRVALNGNVMARNASDEFTMLERSGMQYTFSAPTSSGDYYSRPTEIEAGNGQKITLAYDGANGVGKLTKVTGPASEFTLNLSYSGNLITKVELKKGTTLLEDVEYEYNASNELTKVTDDSGNTVMYSYGSDTNAASSRYISSITDKAGETVDLTWTFADDGTGTYVAQKVVADLPNGLTQEISRSVSTGVGTFLQKDGTTVLDKEVHRPISGDYSRTQYKDLYTDASTYQRWEYQYNSDGLATKLLRPSTTAHWTRAYDSDYRLTSHQETGLTATTYSYAVGGSYATKITDSSGLDTYIDYNANGAITKMRPPHLDSNGVEYMLDSYGQVTKIRRVVGTTNYDTTYASDSIGRLTSVTDPNGGSVSFEYDDHGNVTKETNKRSKSTYYYYDTGGCGSCGSGRLLTKVKDPENNETLLYYDTLGNMTKFTDALNRSVGYEYDEMGRLTKVADPFGSTTNTMAYAYDLLGRMTSVTDFDGNVTTTAYNWFDQMTSVTDPIDSVTFTYHETGQLSTVTDGNGNSVKYAITNAGLPFYVSDVSLAKHFVWYGRDAGGRLTSRTAAAGFLTLAPDKILYKYNAATGLVDEIEYWRDSTNHDDANYYYDEFGRVTKMTDWLGGAGLQYEYDDAGRLTKLKDYDWTVSDDVSLSYTYDAAGNVLTMNDYHGNTTTYTYTDRGQLSTLTAPGSKVWDFDYNALGQPTQYSHPNGMTTVYSYDSRSRLTKIEHKDGSTVKDSFEYALTAGGNITKITQQDGSTWEYWYDGRGRLTKAERDDTDGSTLLHRYTYTYDDGDNMLSKVVYDAVATTTATQVMAYNGGNELTTSTVGATTTTYAYDLWGRMTSKTDGTSTATYDYRYESLLKSVTSDFPGEGDVTYEYGGNVKRRSRTENSTTIEYLWNRTYRVLSEQDSSGVLQRTFIGALAEVSGSSPSTGSWLYLHSDNLGSIRMTANSSKVVQDRFEYSPYGENYSGGTPDTYYGHALMANDGTTGLRYTPYRYYSPKIGRWMTRDPLGQLDSTNLYSYVGSSPLLYTDPLGLEMVGGPTDDPGTNKLWQGFCELLQMIKPVKDEYDRIRKEADEEVKRKTQNDQCVDTDPEPLPEDLVPDIPDPVGDAVKDEALPDTRQRNASDNPCDAAERLDSMERAQKKKGREQIQSIDKSEKHLKKTLRGGPASDFKECDDEEYEWSFNEPK